MLEALFSFRGRINRLQYFLGSIGLGAALMVVLVGAGMALGGSGSVSGLGGSVLAVLVVIVFTLPPYFWVAFSLQTRRFRDMGWNPVFVIPGWIGVDMFGGLGMAHPPLVSIGVLLVNLAMGGCLLFWPGKAAGDWMAEEWTALNRPPPEPTAGWGPQAPVRAAPAAYYPATTSAGAPGAFGRRR